jgi:hypothetical protein
MLCDLDFFARGDLVKKRKNLRFRFRGGHYSGHAVSLPARQAGPRRAPFGRG